MLDKIRQGIRSFFIKIFLGVIIVSFAVWGIGDIFRTPADSTIASVGGTPITLNTFLNEFQRTMNRLRGQLGTDFDQDQARALGYDRLVLNNIVSKEIARQDAEQLGILISDEQIGREIVSDPNFQDEFGTFNRFYFDRLLSITGYTEATYIHEEKARIAGNHIRSGLSGGQLVPEALAAELYRYRRQTRVSELIVLPHTSLATPRAPTNDELLAYYSSHLAQYTTAEERTFRYISLTPTAFNDEVDVSEEELLEEYEFRITQYTVEPTRDFLQLVFNTFDEAQAAYRDLQAGEDFAFVANERLGMAEEDVTFTNVAAPNLPAVIAEDILALTTGELSGPLETAFGWYLVQITGASDGNIQTFDEVQDELYATIALNRTTDLMVGTANSIDDALAGGASLVAIASDFGLRLEEVGPVTRVGGAGIAQEVSVERLRLMLAAVFESYEGAEPELVLTADDDYFMIEITDIDPPSVLSFEEVELQATAGWRVQQRAQLAGQKATEISERLRNGDSGSEIAADEPVTLNISRALQRSGTTGDINVGPILRDKIFSSRLGDIVVGQSLNGTDEVVAQLIRIDAPQTSVSGISAEEDAYERWRVSLDNAWQANVLTAYEQGLNLEFDVSIYTNVLNTAFDTPTF